MSDVETPEQSFSTPTPQLTPKAKGRGRGRGRKAVAPKKEPPKPAATAGTGRRGRFKQFSDDKVQANYERQRELKAQYAALANAVKPALQDLASRSIDTLTNDKDYHTTVPEFKVIEDNLDARFERSLLYLENKLATAARTVFKSKHAKLGAVRDIFKNGVEDMEDRFLDAQLHRLNLLEYLHDHGLPVDLVDAGWNYKQISDKEAQEFGLYEVYVEGALVPYPQIVEGTEAHALRQAAWAEPQTAKETLAPPSAAATGGRTSKRKANQQPDGQPASKRSAADVAPVRHIAGIMSAQHAPIEDESNESTPVPEGPLTADQREPALPAKASEPDEYGCRQVNRPTAKNGASIANRLIVPPSFQFDDDEIGFRDSTNSPRHGATLAKRGKYLGKPNSNTWHFDPLLARWDARDLDEEDYDLELVQKHGTHPRLGCFLPTSRNDAEPPKEEAEPMHPTVFLTPSGKTIHTSRVVPVAKVEIALADKPHSERMGAVLSSICEKEDISPEDIEGPELKALKEIQEEYAEQRLIAESIKESEPASLEDTPATSPLPMNDSALNIAGLEELVVAAEAVEAEAKIVESVEEKPVILPAPTPVRSTTRAYDAIRDIFGGSDSAAVEPPAPVLLPEPIDTTALAILADASTSTYPSQPVDLVMAEAPISQPIPVDGPPPPPHHHHIDSGYVVQPIPAEFRIQTAPSNDSVGWIEPRIASPGADGRIHPSIETPSMRDPYSNQLPPARPVEMSQMRSSIDATNDTRRHSMYHEHNASSAYNEQHLPHPHNQQHLPQADPMIDPRLYSAPMDASAAHHEYQQQAYSQAQQGYQLPSMPMQGGSMAQASPQLQQAGSTSRMPFTNPSQDRSSPLPPLRPSRGRKSAPAAPEQSVQLEQHQIQQQQQQQQQQPPPPPYMNTNSGSFYPPGPPRPYHNGYTQEQPGLPPMMNQYPPYPGSQPPPPPLQQQQQQQQPPPYGHPGMSPTYSSIAPVQSPPNLQFVPQQPNEPSRSRAGSGSSTPSAQGNSKYPKLAPAPLPAHRVGWPQGPELRTVQYDYKENIKDYAPTEPPPRRGPVQIRGWNINNNRIQRQKTDENGDERRGSR
ncbi:hypothetical protein BDP55DRAFT_258653 [Colletotrichum godetiae]|uniref:Uncharacterized protein n=1 Tax=Colletotrichum godetiae TaxID=1209918 RepID=A0AAJ0AVN9_9PEZI|nr:uncharacterized protein BDP55DRAFT_258653 [Colletotrichum godetiae]KAK1691236.1 hypothetical protein BDP55DRAFT_258653 [Colletotrichum godetiae]